MTPVRVIVASYERCNACSSRRFTEAVEGRALPSRADVCGAISSDRRSGWRAVQLWASPQSDVDSVSSGPYGTRTGGSDRLLLVGNDFDLCHSTRLAPI